MNRPCPSLMRLTAALLLPAGAALGAPPISGTWQCPSADGNHTLAINDTTLLFDGDASSYTLRGNAMLVQEEGSVATYRYELKGTLLTITFPDGSLLRCNRAGTTAKPAPAAPPAQK